MQKMGVKEEHERFVEIADTEGGLKFRETLRVSRNGDLRHGLYASSHRFRLLYVL